MLLLTDSQVGYVYVGTLSLTSSSNDEATSK